MGKKKKKRGKVKVQQTDTVLAAEVDKQNELQTGREPTNSKPEVDEQQPGPSAPSVSMQLPASDIESEESESVKQRDLTDAKGKPRKAVNATTISVPPDDQSSRVTEGNFLETSLTREE